MVWKQHEILVGKQFLFQMLSIISSGDSKQQLNWFEAIKFIALQMYSIKFENEKKKHKLRVIFGMEFIIFLSKNV